MEWSTVPIAELRVNESNPRSHSKKQTRALARSIEEFRYFNPIVIDEDNLIIAGHGRVEAAKLLGLKDVPVIRIRGLSPARKRALALADNRIPEGAGWDRKRLAVEIPELAELLVAEELDISITGFEPPEVDQILLDFENDTSDPDDEPDPAWNSDHVVSRSGDLWRLGDHLFLCGNARNGADVNRLMGERKADMVITDPPYNVAVRSIVGRGRIKHAEFAMASGEMTGPEFREFLKSTLGLATSMSRPGSLAFVFMDWRHIADLIEVGRDIYGEMVNLAVWAKSTAGQGSFYRSQHELIGIFRVGGDHHLNNIQLGRHGRTRSNVWHYAGTNTFRKGRMDDLTLHPTVKPIALVADAMRDCTRRGDLVLDPFSGAGTTILAAERVGRQAFAIEIEPRYVDVGIRRWQQFTKRDAILAESGQTFEERSAKTVGGQS